jgi:hypothetical protein
VIFFICIVIVIAAFRLIQACLLPIRERMNRRKQQKSSDSVKPVELTIAQPQTTRVRVSSASPEKAQVTTAITNVSLMQMQ